MRRGVWDDAGFAKIVISEDRPFDSTFEVAGDDTRHDLDAHRIERYFGCVPEWAGPIEEPQEPVEEREKGGLLAGELTEKVQQRLLFIARHREHYIESWLAENAGLLPSQCELLEVEERGGTGSTIRVKIQKRSTWPHETEDGRKLNICGICYGELYKPETTK